MTDQPRTPEDDGTGRSGSSSAGGDWAAADPYGQTPPSDQQPYAPPPSYEQQPYGQQQPYSAQPYGSYPSYGSPALDAEQEKVRSSAILWTILNGASIFLCANLLAVPGVVLAAVAISKARSDVEGARSFVRWSWILFAIGLVGWVLLLIGLVALVGFGGMAAVMSDPALQM